jgi:hypothetical protein
MNCRRWRAWATPEAGPPPRSENGGDRGHSAITIGEPGWNSGKGSAARVGHLDRGRLTPTQARTRVVPVVVIGILSYHALPGHFTLAVWPLGQTGHGETASAAVSCALSVCSPLLGLGPSLSLRPRGRPSEAE